MKNIWPIFLTILLLAPTVTFGLELKYPTIGGITVQMGMDLNALIAWGYYFIVSIAGLAAFMKLVMGGFGYVISAGNPASIADARSQINEAIWGLLLVFTSYIILRVINPDLVILNLPQLPPS